MEKAEEVLKNTVAGELQEYSLLYVEIKKIIHEEPIHANFQIDGYNRYVKIAQLVAKFEQGESIERTDGVNNG